VHIIACTIYLYALIAVPGQPHKPALPGRQIRAASDCSLPGKTTMKIIIALSVLLLAGCAQMQPQMIFTPDGKPAYSVKCADYSMDTCYEQAGKICGSVDYATVKTKEVAGSIRSMTFSCES
jgi:hypothetical protein